MLLTVFLKHDESRPLGELGIGQVVTLRLPASRVREVNRVLEDAAWSAYRTEFYLSYDYKTAGLENHQKVQ